MALSRSGKSDSYGDFQNLNSTVRSRVSKDGRWELVDKQLLSFIWAHNEWVDREVLERLNVREEAAVNVALDQIHKRSLEAFKYQSGKEELSRTYMDVLGNTKGFQSGENRALQNEWKQVKSRKRKDTSPGKQSKGVVTIFLHNIPVEATGREIWSLFQSCGRVVDIILPRKRDISGKRYGFIHTDSEREAGAIINNAKMDRLLGNRIKMTINNGVSNPKIGKGAKETIPSMNFNRGRIAKEDVIKSSNKEEKVGDSIKNSGEDDKAEGNISFSKKMFEFIEVEIDEEVEQALLGCKIGYTWFDAEVESLQETFIQMGLGKYKVNSLSSRKFLIRKDESDNWDDWDKTDMSVWFCQTRNFIEEDYVISGMAWLECKGLPMPAWKEENLKAFTDRLGRWISWSYQSDGFGDFFNPLICLDTTDSDLIRDELTIMYKGAHKKIRFEEVLDKNYLLGKVLPMEFSQEKTNKSQKDSAGGSPEVSVELNGKDQEQESQVDQTVGPGAIVTVYVNHEEKEIPPVTQETP